MASARKIDENGFLLVKGCPISSFGIFEYGAGQLGLDGLGDDPNRIVNVFRPESAVNNPETIESFKNVPFRVDHKMLSGFEEDGDETLPDGDFDGVLTGNVYYDKPWLRGDLKIFSRRAMRALEDGKKELSLGYSCEFQLKPGIYNGKHYEVIQTNLIGNHIALVDEARVPGAKVLDGLCFDHLDFNVRPSKEGLNMPAKKKAALDSGAVEQLQTLIPQLGEALQQFFAEESTEPEHDDMENVNVDEDNTPVEVEAAEPEVADPEATAPETGSDNMAKLVSLLEQLLGKLKGGAAANVETGGADDNGSEAEEGAAAVGDDDDDSDADAMAEDSEEPTEGNGKASPGPRAGENAMASDSAVRKFYADFAVKARLYDRGSKFTGAFDHKSMDSNQVASYMTKKLGLKCKKGHEKIALDSYLLGREHEAKKHKTNPANNGKVLNNSFDSATSPDFGSDLRKHFAGEK